MGEEDSEANPLPVQEEEVQDTAEIADALLYDDLFGRYGTVISVKNGSVELGAGRKMRQALAASGVELTPSSAFAANYEHSSAIETEGRRVFKEGQRAVRFSVGGDFAVAIVNNEICGFGGNKHGAMGVGDFSSGYLDHWQPLYFGGAFPPPKTSVLSLACGKSHLLVLLQNGQVFSCGSNKYGQLGRKKSSTADEKNNMRLKKVSKLTGFTKIWAGPAQSFGLLPDGLVAWGRNPQGQLGVPAESSVVKPTRLIGMQVFTGIAELMCSGSHTAVLLNSGELYMFGCNESGELGSLGHVTSLFVDSPILVANSGLGLQTVLVQPKWTLAVARSGKGYLAGICASLLPYFADRKIAESPARPVSLTEIILPFAHHKPQTIVPAARMLFCHCQNKRLLQVSLDDRTCQLLGPEPEEPWPTPESLRERDAATTSTPLHESGASDEVSESTDSDRESNGKKELLKKKIRPRSTQFSKSMAVTKGPVEKLKEPRDLNRSSKFGGNKKKSETDHADMNSKDYNDPEEQSTPKRTDSVQLTLSPITPVQWQEQVTSESAAADGNTAEEPGEACGENGPKSPNSIVLEDNTELGLESNVSSSAAGTATAANATLAVDMALEVPSDTPTELPTKSTSDGELDLGANLAAVTNLSMQTEYLPLSTLEKFGQVSEKATPPAARLAALLESSTEYLPLSRLSELSTPSPADQGNPNPLASEDLLASEYLPLKMIPDVVPEESDSIPEEIPASSSPDTVADSHSFERRSGRIAKSLGAHRLQSGVKSGPDESAGPSNPSLEKTQKAGFHGSKSDSKLRRRVPKNKVPQSSLPSRPDEAPSLPSPPPSDGKLAESPPQTGLPPRPLAQSSRIVASPSLPSLPPPPLASAALSQSSPGVQSPTFGATSSTSLPALPPVPLGGSPAIIERRASPALSGSGSMKLSRPVPRSIHEQVALFDASGKTGATQGTVRAPTLVELTPVVSQFAQLPVMDAGMLLRATGGGGGRVISGASASLLVANAGRSMANAAQFGAAYPMPMTGAGHSAPRIHGGSLSPSFSSGSSSTSSAAVSLPPPPMMDATEELNREICAEDLVIESKLGSGAYGVVYRAQMGEETVAVKVILPEMFSDEKALADFRAELAIMRRVRHPNVVQMVGYSSKPEDTCIVTKFYGNGSLEHYLRAHSVDWARKVYIGRDVAHGLAYLHDHGIIHRDLAARNVLLDSKLTAYVSDFGYSRVFENAGATTQVTKSSVGPVRWMAPEAILQRKYSQRTDAFSFGVLLWELAMDGAEPYNHMQNLLDVARAVAFDNLRPEIPERVPKPLTSLITRLWDPDPLVRPTLPEARAELDSLAASYSYQESSAAVSKILPQILR